MSAYKEIPQDTVCLEFPAGKSDGTPTKWPTGKLDPTPNAQKEVNFMAPIGRDELMHTKWRTQIGHGVARLMGHTDHTRYVLKDFPEGYNFYRHSKGHVDEPRIDIYLYGSPSGRFRSPQEFIPHALWLMTDETVDRKNCGCKYCASSKTQTQISQDLGLKPIRAVNPSATRTKPVIRAVVPPRKPLSRIVISHDRTADLRSTRRFRVGELVWCALSPIIRGPHPDECIEFWPGLVNETRLNNEVMPHTLGEKWRVVQNNVYKIKLLAVLHSYVLPESAILPYQAYCPSVNLIEPLRRAGNPDLLRDVSGLSQFNPVFLGPEASGNSQLRFVEASTPFALAIQIAAHLVRLWTPSDEWTFYGETPPPTSVAQPRSSPTTVSFTEARHQGLWWGAERIWVEELVRLQPERSQVVPQGSQVICRASPRADGRGVFMRINSIFAASASGAKDTNRECKVAGVLYELAEDSYEEVSQSLPFPEAPSSDPVDHPPMPSVPDTILTDTLTLGKGSGSGPSSRSTMVPSSPLPLVPISSPINLPNLPAYPLPEAPSGYKFRQITKSGFEIILDVSLIAGRYYPGLLKHPLLQDALADVDMNESRVTQLTALCGLLAGSMNSMECIDWVGSRLTMIRLADVKAQQDLHQHWHKSSPAEQHPNSEMNNSNDSEATKHTQT